MKSLALSSVSGRALAILCLVFAFPFHALSAPLRIAIPSLPERLDPHDGNALDDNRITKQIFDTLVDFDSAASPIPSIAKSWKIDHKSKTITFILDSAKFHDGTQVSAEAVRTALVRSVKRENPWAVHLKHGQSCDFNNCPAIEATGPDTLKLTLQDHTYEPLLRALASSTCAILKETKEELIGSGPFQIVRRTQSELSLRRVRPASPGYIDEILFIQASPEEAKKGFLKGDFDELWNLQLSDVEEKATQKIRFAFYGTYVMVLNVTTGTLSKRGMRQAIRLTLDGAKILSALDRDGIPATGYLPKGLVGHINSNGPTDLEMARSLVRKAAPDGKAPIRLALHSSYREKTAFIDYLKQSLISIGFKPEVEFMEFTPALKAMKAGTIDATIKADSVQYYDPATMFVPLMTGNFANVNHFSNVRLDEIVHKAETTSDPNVRRLLLEEAEQILQVECPIVPLYYPARFAYYSNRLETSLNPDGEIRYWEFPYKNFRWKKQ